MRTRLILAAVFAASALGPVAADANLRPASSASPVVPSGSPSGIARVADQPTALDLAIAAVERAENLRAELASRHTQLVTRYQLELGAIDTLKRQKASWRRDRALRGRLATSLELATALSTLTERRKTGEHEVGRTRAVAVAAIDRVLPLVAGAHRADLLRRRQGWAEAGLRSPRIVIPIVIPDDALDPLADPEELEQQAAELREAEAALAGEIDRLDHQVERFERMAAVRRQHERSEELDRRDDADPRRVTVRGAGDSAAVADGASSPTEHEDVDGTESSADGRDLATSLADVVDPRTVDALRRAEHSTDPAIRAAAVRRARQGVAHRLTTLARRRAAIERRARQLRTGE